MWHDDRVWWNWLVGGLVVWAIVAVMASMLIGTVIRLADQRTRRHGGRALVDPAASQRAVARVPHRRPAIADEPLVRTPSGLSTTRRPAA